MGRAPMKRKIVARSRLRRILRRLLRQTVYAAVLVALVAAAHAFSWFGRPPVHVYVAYVLTEPVDVEDVLARLQNWARRWLPEESVWPWRG